VRARRSSDRAAYDAAVAEGYDAEVDVLYVPVGHGPRTGDVDRTVEVDDPRLGDLLLVDLDVDGRILGFEIPNATRRTRLDV
jgi:uncharacterized protein YuzE